MRKSGPVFALLVVLALSGCSAAAVESAPTGERAAPTASATAGPIDLSTVTPDPVSTEAASGVIENGEEIYLKATRSGLHGMESVSDAQLLATGYYACELIAGGESPDDVDVIQGAAAGEPVPEWNDAALAGLATETLCVEYNQSN